VKARRDQSAPSKHLRARAERLLHKTRRDIAQMPVEDVQKVVHELQVHQIELEMQNGELRRVQADLETSRDRFAMLYDSAPVGFLTLDTQSVIHENNLAATRLLNLGRTKLSGQKLTHFVAPASQDTLYLHRRQVFSTGDKQICELRMLKTDGTKFIARLETVVERAEQGRPRRCLVMLSDITQEKQAEHRLAANLAISRILAESPSLGDATPKILQTIGETLGWELGAAWTVDSDANVLRCLKVWHDAAAKVNKFESVWYNRTFSPDIGLPGRVWTGLKPAWIPDVTKDKNFPRAPVAAAEGLHAAFAFPILFGGRFLAVMEFFSHEIRQPDDALLEMFRSVGSQIGQFLERKRAEGALQESEARKGAILESAPDGIMTIDQQGRVTEFNPSAERIFGYRREEILGQEMAEVIIPPALRERHRRGLAHYLATGEGPVLGKRIELTALRRDGTEFPVELSLTRIACEGPPVFTGFVRDITERKRAAMAVSHLAAIVESSADSIVGETLDGTIVSWNLAAQRIYGYTGEEVIGRSIGILVPPDPAEERPRFLESVGRGERIEHYETVHLRKDGRQIPVSLTISPITDVTGQITGVSTISRDITERKRVEQHLQAALQEKEVLLQEVHHRVKNNLQVVSSLLNLQSNTVQDAQTREAFRESRDRIKSMALIHEKLYQSTDLARIEFSEYLRDLLVELFRSYGPKASAIRLQVEAPPVRLDLNTAVPVGLILNELVSNCLKHAFPGGKSGLVRIELQTEQATQFRLAVRDNGVGFPPDFDLGNIPTLGLRLVRILISQLGGALVIQRSGEWTECLVAFKNPQ